eukprot:TRINITY_DN45267_c0_g1_i3.p1 TRINITY_DN45267_c0_g1~~TRINITY_DN45267_c0_g1_i3.p1  ORF type:complete len:419 (+),score=55.32 TRINITY_DN45267_c0_g1_i3:363-1619(+)
MAADAHDDAARLAAVVAGAAEGAAAREDHDPHETNLKSFYRHVNFDRRIPGTFTKVRKIAKCIHGVVEIHRWVREGEEDRPVVCKKMPTANVRVNEGRMANERQIHLCRDPNMRMQMPHLEDAMNEIAVITLLSRQADCPRYLLRMLDSFIEGDHTWLLTEHADGGEFFEHVSNRLVVLNEDSCRRYFWQLIQAVRHLHQHSIGHRDISLENILITFAHDAPGQRRGEFRLMDYGGACRTRSATGELLRYWRPVGKVVPPADGPPGARLMLARLMHPQHRGYLCEVMLPPDAVPGQPCTASLWGYAVPSMDIFACGVCLFIMSWGLPPWGEALLSDQLFRYIYNRADNGITELLRQWRKEFLSPPAMDLLMRMMRADPQGRPSAEECLAHEWLAPLAAEEVPVHLPHPWEAPREPASP